MMTRNVYVLFLFFQAIAIAGCFMDEGSILVVCPAVLRYSWAEEIERWLPSCLPADIHLGNVLLLSCVWCCILVGIHWQGW
jgi:SNF2 family DNA or RNA helicase